VMAEAFLNPDDATRSSDVEIQRYRVHRCAHKRYRTVGNVGVLVDNRQPKCVLEWIPAISCIPVNFDFSFFFFLPKPC